MLPQRVYDADTTRSLVIAAVVVVSFLGLFVRYRRRNGRVNPGLKAVLITGCDSGFGHALAERLDADGYKVFAGCLDANCEGARLLQSKTSPKLELIQLDVTEDEQIEAARVAVAELLMGNVLWAVVNNAGVACHAEFEWTPKKTFQKIIEVNLMGVVNVTRAFLPLVRAAKGRVVNISSMAGRTALPGFTAYSASKFAVLGFSDSLRREMKHFGVKVITLEPALYKTAMASTSTVLSQNDAFWSNAEPGVRRDYGDNFFSDTQAARKNLMRWASDNVHEVVDDYMDAITATRPCSRYVAPLSLRILNDAMTALFTRVQDAIIGYITGVRARPDMLCPLLHENNNRGMGRRRSHAT
ncbi:unnamed protein product [Lymnaea stagnalis]|uniref:Uncharacterized protein n=1 Tax=Lymnaea stagnalis TaxID=6523 RepID=A0AAV2I6V2_LYMST